MAPVPALTIAEIHANLEAELALAASKLAEKMMQHQRGDGGRLNYLELALLKRKLEKIKESLNKAKKEQKEEEEKKENKREEKMIAQLQNI